MARAKHQRAGEYLTPGRRFLPERKGSNGWFFLAQSLRSPTRMAPKRLVARLRTNAYAYRLRKQLAAPQFSTTHAPTSPVCRSELNKNYVLPTLSTCIACVWSEQLVTLSPSLRSLPPLTSVNAKDKRSPDCQNILPNMHLTSSPAPPGRVLRSRRVSFTESRAPFRAAPARWHSAGVPKSKPSRGLR